MGRAKRRIGDIVVIVVEERVEELGCVVLIRGVEGGESVGRVILASGGICLRDQMQEILTHGAAQREIINNYVIPVIVSIA